MSRLVSVTETGTINHHDRNGGHKGDFFSLLFSYTESTFFSLAQYILHTSSWFPGSILLKDHSENLFHVPALPPSG